MTPAWAVSFVAAERISFDHRTRIGPLNLRRRPAPRRGPWSSRPSRHQRHHRPQASTTLPLSSKHRLQTTIRNVAPARRCRSLKPDEASSSVVTKPLATEPLQTAIRRQFQQESKEDELHTHSPNRNFLLTHTSLSWNRSRPFSTHPERRVE
jgi:hypothetical protein